jgi:predicted HTH transcriptional regulator
MRENRLNEPLKFSVIKTIAAFLNTDGGNLLIGVDDERKLVGLQGDYSLFRKGDSRDALENWLVTQLIDQFGKPATRLYAISFHETSGQDVCGFEVQPSPEPVYVDKDEKTGKPPATLTSAPETPPARSISAKLSNIRHRWPSR